MRRLDPRRLVLTGIALGVGSALLLTSDADGPDRLGACIIAAGAAQFTFAIETRTATRKPPRFLLSYGQLRIVASALLLASILAITAWWLLPHPADDWEWLLFPAMVAGSAAAEALWRNRHEDRDTFPSLLPPAGSGS